MFVKNATYRVVNQTSHQFSPGTIVKYKGAKISSNSVTCDYAFECVRLPNDSNHYPYGTFHTCDGLVPSRQGQWIYNTSDVVRMDEEDLEDLYV